MASNPLSMRAGIALLEVLEQSDVYDYLDKQGKQLEDGLLELIEKHNVKATINRIKGALTIYFTDKKVENSIQAKTTNAATFGKFFKSMLNKGINLPSLNTYISF